MTIYYVSANDGSNANSGTSLGAPLATLQAAADLTEPGDTVEVESGIYAAPSNGGTALDITTSGVTGHIPRVRPRSAPGSLDVACRSALPR